MFTRRYPKIALVTALSLLGFTLMDLVGDVFAYPFCAADLEPSPTAAAPVEMSLRPSGDQVPTSSPGGHIDCCICCSGCVEYSPAFRLPADTTATRNEVSCPVRRTLLLVCQLFHPPRIS